MKTKQKYSRLTVLYMVHKAKAVITNLYLRMAGTVQIDGVMQEHLLSTQTHLPAVACPTTN